MRRVINFIAATKEFNTSMNSTSCFTREQIKNILKRVGLPYANFYISVLIKERLLIKTNNRYRFAKAPIHYLEFERALRICHQERYDKPVTRRSEELHSEDSDVIQDAINLLKKHNYLVFKPC